MNDMSFRALVYPFAILAACILLVMPVSAASNTIMQGNTVFIGEQGLDISAALGGATQIAWFRPGSNPAVDVPSSVVNVGNPASFYISPSVFVGKTGNWFQWNGGNPAGPVAFVVEEATIRLRVFDATRGYEVRPGVTWVPTGDSVSFTIETNLYQMVQRPGVVGAVINIRVDGPGGLAYTRLTGPDGTSTPLRTVVDRSPYSTGPIWDTGLPEYPNGTYEMSADCNTNKMNDNYWAGSDTVTMLLQNFNPLITPATPGTVPTTRPVTTATTMPPTVTGTSVPATSVPITTLPVTTVTTAPTTVSPTTTPGFEVITALSGVLGAFLLIWRR
jgi:hypothetical protein